MCITNYLVNYLFFFFERESCSCSPGYLRTLSVDQAGLELRDLTASIPGVLGLKAVLPLLAIVSGFFIYIIYIKYLFFFFWFRRQDCRPR